MQSDLVVEKIRNLRVDALNVELRAGESQKVVKSRPRWDVLCHSIAS